MSTLVERCLKYIYIFISWINFHMQWLCLMFSIFCSTITLITKQEKAREDAEKKTKRKANREKKEAKKAEGKKPRGRPPKAKAKAKATAKAKHTKKTEVKTEGDADPKDTLATPAKCLKTSKATWKLSPAAVKTHRANGDQMAREMLVKLTEALKGEAGFEVPNLQTFFKKFLSCNYGQCQHMLMVQLLHVKTTTAWCVGYHDHCKLIICIFKVFWNHIYALHLRSFTLKAPGPNMQNIGVVLYQKSFYVGCVSGALPKIAKDLDLKATNLHKLPVVLSCEHLKLFDHISIIIYIYIYMACVPRQALSRSTRREVWRFLLGMTLSICLLAATNR